MSTFRVNKNVNYTVMSNHHLQDKRLSLKAKGLLSYMLSLPDDWDYSLKGLTVGCKDGLDSVRTAVLELEEHGYVRRQKVRNAKGQIIDYDYQVYESPVEDAPAVPGKEGGPSNPSASKSPKSRMKPCSSPFLDFPNLAEPNLEKATQQNTNKQNTKKQSTNLSGQTSESADFDQMEAQVREEFRERLEIDTLAQRYDPDKLEELLDNIVEMYCCPRQTQYVGKQPQTTKAIRLRLGKAANEADALLVVLNFDNTQIGILVDAVDQMIEIPSEDILPVPSQSSQQLVSGMCTIPDGSGTMLVLDCERLLSHEY